MSLLGNASLPKSFRTEAQTAIADFQKANDAPLEAFEKRLMKMAKTDEEREAVRQILEEAKAEDAAPE